MGYKVVRGCGGVVNPEQGSNTESSDINCTEESVMSSLEENVAKMKAKQTGPAKLDAKLAYTWRKTLAILAPDLAPIPTLTGKEMGFIRAYIKRVGELRAEPLFNRTLEQWGDFVVFCSEQQGIKLKGSLPNLGVIASHAQELLLWDAADKPTKEVNIVEGTLIDPKTMKW